MTSHGGFLVKVFTSWKPRGFNDPRGKLLDVMIDKIEASSRKPSILARKLSFHLNGDKDFVGAIQERLNELGFWFFEQNAIEIDANAHRDRSAESDFMFACNKDDFDFNH